MAVDTQPPAAAGGRSRKGLSGWIKKNKLAAGGVAAGGAFLFLSKKGDGGAPASLVSDMPAATPISEATGDYGGSGGNVGDGGEASGEVGGSAGTGTDTATTPDDLNPPDPADAAPAGITVVVQSPEPTSDREAPETPAANVTRETATTQQGITLAGHFFAGSTGSIMTGSGSNQYGKYMIHRVAFPGRQEYWWHYTSGSASGKWTGPHTPAEAVKQAQANAPAPVIKVTTKAPASGGGGGGGSSSGGGGGGGGGREQPKMGANIFYNADRNLRYIIQKHSNGKNYKHYESKLNKGDWGSGAGPGVIPQ